jgi:hypothetical protein
LVIGTTAGPYCCSNKALKTSVGQQAEEPLDHCWLVRGRRRAARPPLQFAAAGYRSSASSAAPGAGRWRPVTLAAFGERLALGLLGALDDCQLAWPRPAERGVRARTGVLRVIDLDAKARVGVERRALLGLVSRQVEHVGQL